MIQVLDGVRVLYTPKVLYDGSVSGKIITEGRFTFPSVFTITFEV